MYYMNLINELYKEKIQYELKWLEKYNKACEEEQNEENEKFDNFNIIVFLIVFMFIIAILIK